MPDVRENERQARQGAELIEEKDMPMPRTTLWRLRKAGKLACYRVGRRVYYSPDHLREMLSRSEERAA